MPEHIPHEIRLRPLSLEVRADAATGRIVGLASPFDAEPDSYGDTVAPGAFAASLATHGLPKMLWQHDPAQPVGVWDRAEERSDGLHVEGRLLTSTAAGRDALEHVRAGSVSGLSIGYKVKAAERINGGRRLTAVELWEVSLVTFPAAAAARVQEFASAADLRAQLRRAGFAKGAAAKIAAGGWSALAAEAPDASMSELVHRLELCAAKLKRI